MLTSPQTVRPCGSAQMEGSIKPFFQIMVTTRSAPVLVSTLPSGKKSNRLGSDGRVHVDGNENLVFQSERLCQVLL